MKREVEHVQLFAALDDCASAVSALRRVGARGARAVDAPEAIRGDIQRRLDHLCQAARDGGLAVKEAEAMLLPLAALADEVVLAQRDSLATLWSRRKLQMHYFQEDVAGELVFRQLDEAQADPRVHPLVLRSYFVCLCLGFQGRYAIQDDRAELDRVRESLRSVLQRRGELRTGERLSLHAEHPKTVSAEAGRRQGLVWLVFGVGCLLLLSILLVQVAMYFKSVNAVEERLWAKFTPQESYHE